MHDLSRLDRLVEKLKTLDPTFAMGVGYLFLAAMWSALETPWLVAAPPALFGVVMVGAGLRGGGPFRSRAVGEDETGRIPSERRHLPPGFRIFAGILGACGIIVAVWSAADGSWFGVPISLLIGVGGMLIAITGWGRVWVERPRDAAPASPPA